MNPFSSQLERLARTLTDQFGVTVFCKGDLAYTDGRRIVLPSLPEPLDPLLERMVIGYLDHEMSHVAFTDFNEVRRFATKHPGFKDLLNAVEDALIERRAMARWPGVRANLDALFNQVRPRVLSSIASARPFDRFAIAVYLGLCHHQDLLGFESELAGFEDLLDEFPAVRTTRDAARLSSKLLKRWLQRMTSQRTQPLTATPSPQPDASPTSGDSNSRTPDDSASESDDSDDLASKAGSSGNPPQSDPSDGAENSEAPEPDSEQADHGANSINSANWAGGGTSLFGEVVATAINEAMNALDGHDQYRVFTRQYDRIEVVPDADDTAVRALQSTGTDAVRRLRRGLANALRSAEKCWWRDEQTSGQLSPRALHRLCLDRASLGVFRTRSVVQGKSTAVSIALDASGSMSSVKMDVARDALRALLAALHDLKIPTEAFTFTTGDAFDADRAASETGISSTDIRLRFTRFGNLEIGLIKRFEDTLKVAVRRLPNIVGTGLTPIGEALEIGARRLLPRPENRKILLILTDGQPCCESSGSAAFTHAIHVARRISNAGIDLVGVGILDTTLRSIVDNTIVVNQIGDLPAQLCKLLGRTLKKGLNHVA